MPCLRAHAAMRHGHVARSLRNMRSMPMPSPPYTRSLHNSPRAGAHACGPSMVKFHATSRGHKWWSGTQPAFGGECGAVHSPVVACTHMPRSTFLASVGAIAVLPQPTFLGASERCQRDASEMPARCAIDLSGALGGLLAGHVEKKVVQPAAAPPADAMPCRRVARHVALAARRAWGGEVGGQAGGAMSKRASASPPRRPRVIAPRPTLW